MEHMNTPDRWTREALYEHVEKQVRFLPSSKGDGAGGAGANTRSMKEVGVYIHEFADGRTHEYTKKQSGRASRHTKQKKVVKLIFDEVWRDVLIEQQPARKKTSIPSSRITLEKEMYKKRQRIKGLRGNLRIDDY